MGELSPQVTERVLQPLSDGKVNLIAHTTKLSVNLSVGESQNLQTKSRQELRTLSVISQALGFIMLGSIQCNDQSGRSAVKVHDESADDPLFVNFHRILAEKKIPELALVGCHFSAKPPGIFQLAVVFWYGHILPSPSSLCSATSPKGRGKRHNKRTTPKRCIDVRSLSVRQIPIYLTVCFNLSHCCNIYKNSPDRRFCGDCNCFVGLRSLRQILFILWQGTRRRPHSWADPAPWRSA